VSALLDSNIWIDLTRLRSSTSLKSFIAPFTLDPRACLAEPVIFEVLRSATDDEARQLTQHFQTLPILASPGDLWSSGVELGRACRRAGLTAGSIDLLIAAVAIHHDAQLLTFDRGFLAIADVCPLRVKLLQRPAP